MLQHRQSSRLSLSPKIVWLEQIKYVRGEMSEWPRVQQELCTGGTENSQAKPSQMCQPGGREGGTAALRSMGKTQGTKDCDEAEGLKRAREGCKAWLQQGLLA